MDQDPVARKQVAKIAKYRGEYDRWGNRLTRTMLNTKHLLENSNDDIFKTIEKEMEDEYYINETSDVEDDYSDSRIRDTKLNLSEYNFGIIQFFQTTYITKLLFKNILLTWLWITTIQDNVFNVQRKKLMISYTIQLRMQNFRRKETTRKNYNLSIHTQL